MDTSNPVVTSDRRTLGEAKALAVLRKRQNLDFIQSVGRTAERIHLPVNSELLSNGEAKAVLVQLAEQAPQISNESLKELPQSCFNEVMDKMPVCGILSSDGIPIHPPSVNNEQGHVIVRRNFGGAFYKPLGGLQLAEVLGTHILEVDSVYSHGTAEGFLCRLEKQMGRKAVQVSQTIQNGSKGVNLPLKALQKIFVGVLNECMPVEDHDDLPSLNDPLDELLDAIEITLNSSAGPPYHAPKLHVLDVVLNTGIVAMVDAIKSDRLEQFMKEQPEMFLCEVKNKLDRYKVDELQEKTRPYMCYPAHCALLFSVLCQKFQRRLKIFTEKGSNAYGFSGAKGGYKKMVQWMYSGKVGLKFICYGDDTRLIIHCKDGRRYMVNPDFQQMDGSVDATTISWTVDWILANLSEDGEKPNNFWQAIASLWKQMATTPRFCCHGTKIWEKKSKDGLMTGVPGTTLFDTVKAVVAWQSFVAATERSEVDPLNPEAVTAWMKLNAGLVIKEGTYVPELLPILKETLTGDLIGSGKFLGVQIKKEIFQNETLYVPTLPYREMVQMLVVQKDDPLVPTKSALGSQRLLFDRMRGLMITFGFTEPLIVDAIHHVVNTIPVTAVVMETQLKGGEKPESITLQDFAYPDSDGFPSIEFCKAVYSDLEFDRKPYWISIFPGMVESFKNLRVEAKGVVRSYKVLKPDGTIETRVVMENKDFSTKIDVPDVIHKPKVPRHLPEPHVRSQIIDTSGTRKPVTPTLGESISLMLDAAGGTLNMADIYDRFGCTPTQVLTAASGWGFFLNSFTREGIISTTPIQTPLKTPQDYIVQKMVENKKLVTKGSDRRLQAIAKVNGPVPKETILTAPVGITLVDAFMENLKAVELTYQNDTDPLQVIGMFLAKQPEHFQLHWKSKVLSQTPDRIEAQLSVKHEKNYFFVGKATSQNFREAKVYLTVAFLRSFDELQKMRGKLPLFQDFLDQRQSNLTVRPKEAFDPDAQDWVKASVDPIPEQWNDIPPPEMFRDSYFEEIENFVRTNFGLRGRRLAHVVEFVNSITVDGFTQDEVYMPFLLRTIQTYFRKKKILSYPFPLLNEGSKTREQMVCAETHLRALCFQMSKNAYHMNDEFHTRILAALDGVRMLLNSIQPVSVLEIAHKRFLEKFLDASDNFLFGASEENSASGFGEPDFPDPIFTLKGEFVHVEPEATEPEYWEDVFPPVEVRPATPLSPPIEEVFRPESPEVFPLEEPEEEVVSKRSKLTAARKNKLTKKLNLKRREKAKAALTLRAKATTS